MALAALAIMTILLLAIFQGTSHQGRSAESAVVYAREQMLADTASALVMGQIKEATSQSGQAWISQPGLLRTYAAATPRQPSKCYKLYSNANETDSSGGIGFLAADVPADWNSTANQNLYVDLNAPVSAGFLAASVYPILDPAVMANTGGSVSSDTNAVTMPVQWIYELQDGTLGPASNGTKANPIVGRIAYWTDDDTCKININTAGCASPWNTPRVNSADDVGWSTTVPAIGEYSRYPGHAAQTSLAEVFGQGNPPLNAQQLLSLNPRYGWGGSQFGALATAAGETVLPKTDRLYASLDELCFGTGITSGQRAVGLIAPAQIEQDRFVLTAHSEAPETNLLGEPRVAIWPVADAPTDSTVTTADDRAVAGAATVGVGTASPREYFFQRHSSLNSTDDFDASTTPGQSNSQLFSDLLNRRFEVLPGYGATFEQKYPDASWTQLMLEIADFIHGLNAIDPTAGATVGSGTFAPFAAADANTGAGSGFILPLTTVDPTTSANLRGLGRCPTLSSLTLVIYVSGFTLDDGSTVDFETMSDSDRASTWEADFDPGVATNRLAHVNGELVRAFVVPCTFHPGCGFPEVSDDCTLQISGLDGLTLTTTTSAGQTTSQTLGFAATATSSILGTPLQILSDRAWGGNEGPLAWRLAGDALANGSTASFPYGYPFAGGVNAVAVPFSTKVQYNAATKTATWPALPTLSCSSCSPTVTLQDAHAATLQTLALSLPSFTVTAAPTIDREADHYDGATPATADSNWKTDATMKVVPSFYMNLQNRLRATQGNRPLMIQPGDVVRGLQAASDFRAARATTRSRRKLMIFVSPMGSALWVPTARARAFRNPPPDWSTARSILIRRPPSPAPISPRERRARRRVPPGSPGRW
jgi:uncharacterized protein (TIGR02600 family)